MFAVIIMGGCPFVFDRNILVFEISFQQNDRLTKFHLLLKKNDFWWSMMFVIFLDNVQKTLESH